MKQNNSIVVYGGSFNPPLNSHFSIAQDVLNQYKEVEKIIFVPVNKNYPKEGLLENEHRYNMLKLVADKNHKFIISNLDFQYKQSLPTIDTLREIQKQYPDKEVWFLIGSDNLKYLDTWDEAESLVSKYKVLVMERDEDKLEEIIEINPLFKSHKENFKKLSQEIRSNISSTYVRKQIQKGNNVRYLLPDEVLEYIEQNDLYRR